MAPRTGSPGGREARKLRFRLFRLLTLRLALTYSAGSLFAFGFLALLLRILLDSPVSLLALLLPIAACLPIVPAAWLASRRTPGADQCLAWLDAAGNNGGLLLIADRPGADAWRSLFPSRLPKSRLTWCDPIRPAGWLTALAFSLAVLLIPSRIVHAVLSSPLDLSPLVSPLEKKVEALLDPAMPMPAQSKEWEQELNKFAALEEGEDANRALEALDHLREQIEQAGAQAADTLTQEQDLLRAAAAAAESVQSAYSDGGVGAEAAQSALDSFNKFASNQEWPAALTNGMPPELLADLKGGTLTPDQLKDLEKRLKEAGDAHAKSLSRLCNAQLANASQCPEGSLGTNAAACESALNRYLEGKDGESLSSCLRGGSGGGGGCKPGSGGISRGRADAALTWKDPSSSENAGFKETLLPTGAMPDPEKAKPIGLSSAAPDATPGTEPLQPGALAGAGATPQPGRNVIILPRHREAVERYFQSEPPPERKP